jgi:hypothetical protein
VTDKGLLKDVNLAGETVSGMVIDSTGDTAIVAHIAALTRPRPRSDTSCSVFNFNLVKDIPSGGRSLKPTDDAVSPPEKHD